MPYTTARCAALDVGLIRRGTREGGDDDPSLLVPPIPVARYSRRTQPT